MALNNVK